MDTHLIMFTTIIKLGFLGFYFLFNSSRPSQQFFSYVGTILVEPVLSKDKCVLPKDTTQLQR